MLEFSLRKATGGLAIGAVIAIGASATETPGVTLRTPEETAITPVIEASQISITGIKRFRISGRFAMAADPAATNGIRAADTKPSPLMPEDKEIINVIAANNSPATKAKRGLRSLSPTNSNIRCGTTARRI